MQFRSTSETINWRCSNFIRHKCKARAITREIDGREMVRLSRPQHTHDIDQCDTFEFAYSAYLDDGEHDASYYLD